MKILILMTNQATLHLLDGEIYPSGFWAEEFVLPYKRFKEEGYDVDIATIGGIPPTVDGISINPDFAQYVRPAGVQEDDVANSAKCVELINSLPDLKEPKNLDTFTKEQVAAYNGIYLSGGHGAIGDMPKSHALTMVLLWAVELNIPIAAVCHGHSGLLNLRNAKGEWPFAGYRLTSFSHDEELVTNMAGRLPFVLEVELRRLGGLYEKADVIWGSHVVVDRNLITGQNPYSSKALADAMVKKLEEVNSGATAQ